MSNGTRIPLQPRNHSFNLPIGKDGIYSQIQNDSSEMLYPNKHAQALGIPSTKKAVDITDIASISVSLLCLAAGLLVVADESISWSVGVRNYQLVVIGFLLSIMTICLTSVAPTFFLLVEARFGSSTLQNYEGILRNQILKSHLSLVWRLAFAAMLLLPIGLSAAYKTFQGGESSRHVNPADYLGNQSYYGMYPLPGLQSVGRYSGLNLFSNATLSFLLATSPTNGVEPVLPEFPKAYGYNHLVLSNQSAAILDTPQTDYISTVQRLLQPGESWLTEASVLGTVAIYDTSNATDPKRYNSTFMDICLDDQYAAEVNGSSGAYTKLPMYNGYNIVLIDRPSPGNQSLQYIGFDPVLADTISGSCTAIAPYAQLFGVVRQQCKGTWSISRSSVRLVSGSCDGPLAPLLKQEVITNNNLVLGYWYMPSLAEILGTFATTRNQSEWRIPSFASAVAAMLWSRITAVDGDIYYSGDSHWESLNLTSEEAGLAYAVKDSAIYIRPTMRKSPLLYLILIIQPAICVAIVLMKCAFYSTPIDRGFGLISILAGLNTENLENLHGAALSGELKQKVQLAIEPQRRGDLDTSAVEYRLVLDSIRSRNGRLDHHVVYN